MVIAGPNGAGKSTLLNGLRAVTGQHNVIYAGPHRASRRHQVLSRSLIGQRIWLEELMSTIGGGLPGLEGLNIGNTARDAWDYDPASSYVKFAICQVAMERQAALTERYDQDGSLSREAIPDVWAPLRDLTGNLLPHLRFERVDSTNPNGVNCLFRTHDDAVIDFDELSSGEKAVVQLFYPLIEHRVRQILGDIRRSAPASDRGDLAVLIDEPELHLHPNLQVKALDYMRALSVAEPIQFILATQSPVISDYASADELFVLKPKEVVAPGDNQLQRVADSEEHLGYIRSIFRATSNLTALQPLIVVEGTEIDKRGGVPDQKLYRALYPTFDRVTLVSGGGKGEVLRLRKKLEDVLGSFGHSIPVLALVDADLAASAPEHSIALPVSMIENLLLDPETIHSAIESVQERTGLSTIADTTSAIDGILNSLQPDEIQRRCVNILGVSYFRPASPADSIPDQARFHAEEILRQYSVTTVSEALANATSDVAALEASHRRREHFHGKRVLDEFYRRYLTQSGMSKQVFLFECARHARRRASVQDFFTSVFQRVTAMQQRT